MFVRADSSDIERIYRLSADITDGVARNELLQSIYDIFGSDAHLRPPAAEARLADACKPKAVKHG